MHFLSLYWGGRFFCPPVCFLYIEGSLISSFFVNIFLGFTDKKKRCSFLGELGEGFIICALFGTPESARKGEKKY